MAESYCLKHQERLATARCAACLKPLCDECTLPSEEGNFCGVECHQKRLAANVRVEKMAEEEKEMAAWRFQRKLISTAVWLAIFLGVAVGWPYLPEALTGPIENFWHQVFPK
ncbi:MAG: hypothetical protein AB7S38_25230 [Vulcanimicrobiota bacterium]